MIVIVCIINSAIAYKVYKMLKLDTTEFRLRAKILVVEAILANIIGWQHLNLIASISIALCVSIFVYTMPTRNYN